MITSFFSASNGVLPPTLSTKLMQKLIDDKSSQLKKADSIQVG
jgi:hypothetical protein